MLYTPPIFLNDFLMLLYYLYSFISFKVALNGYEEIIDTLFNQIGRRMAKIVMNRAVKICNPCCYFTYVFKVFTTEIPAGRSPILFKKGFNLFNNILGNF